MIAMFLSLLVTIIQAVFALLNEVPINTIPLGASAEFTATFETLAGTFTATNLWFVTRTPDTPDPPPEPPAGYIGIYDIDDLQAIGNDPAYPLDGDYVLMNDIDASATATWNGGAGFAPIGTFTSPFTGTLNGQNFSVTDLYINQPSSNVVGLIARNSGTISFCNISGAVTGNLHVGGLIGWNSNVCENCLSSVAVVGYGIAGSIIGTNSGGEVNFCGATGAVQGESNVGGLVGANNGGAIYKSFASGVVLAGTNGGGLVGDHVSAWVEDCYATGAVTATGGGAGGLLGWSNGTITNCYATGAVTGGGGLGGLVGYDNLSTVTASYYDTTTSGQADNVGKGLPRITAAMMQQATFVGWDFGVVWTIDEGVDYPRLMWE